MMVMTVEPAHFVHIRGAVPPRSETHALRNSAHRDVTDVTDTRGLPQDTPSWKKPVLRGRWWLREGSAGSFSRVSASMCMCTCVCMQTCACQRRCMCVCACVCVCVCVCVCMCALSTTECSCSSAPAFLGVRTHCHARQNVTGAHARTRTRTFRGNKTQTQTQTQVAARLEPASIHDAFLHLFLVPGGPWLSAQTSLRVYKYDECSDIMPTMHARAHTETLSHTHSLSLSLSLSHTHTQAV